MTSELKIYCSIFKTKKRRAQLTVSTSLSIYSHIRQTQTMCNVMLGCDKMTEMFSEIHYSCKYTLIMITLYEETWQDQMDGSWSIYKVNWLRGRSFSKIENFVGFSVLYSEWYLFT